MIFVDTSVWIDHLRTVRADLAAALLADQVLTHPFIIGEVARGNLRQRREVLALLDDLPGVPMATENEAGAFLEQRELMGKGIKYIDVHPPASPFRPAGPLPPRSPPMNRTLRVILPLLPVVLAIGCGADERASAPASELASSAPATYVDAGDGVRLFYRTMGSGGDTVVVIHGGPGFNMEYFVEDLAPLAEGRTLLFYDQRGAGGSTLVEDSAALDGQRFVEDLEAIRSHFGMERLTILGHSWGAAVAALYAERHPERVGRLAIVGGVPLRQGELAEAFQRLEAGRDSATRRQMEERYATWHADPGDAAACRAYYDLWFQPFFADPAAATRTRGDFCAGSPESLRNKVANVDRFVFASLGEWDWRPFLRDVAAPTLLVHGTHDPLPLEGARGWATTMPNSRLLLLEGVGHFPYLEAPESFFGPVDEFLRGGWPAEARAAADL